MSKGQEVRTPGEVPAAPSDTPKAEDVASKSAANRTRRQASVPGVPPGTIPKAEDVDATKIERAVLTTSGYVVPAPRPEPLKQGFR